MLELTRKESTKKLIGTLKLKMAFYAMEDAGRYVSLVLSFDDTLKEKMQILISTNYGLIITKADRRLDIDCFQISHNQVLPNLPLYLLTNNIKE